MSNYLKTILPILLSFLVFSPKANAVNFTSQEKERLQSGKAVIKLMSSSGQKGFYGGTGYALIDAPVDEVWKVLKDWPAYTKMFPNTEQCIPVSKKGNRTLLKMRIGHPVVNIKYHVQVTENEKRRTLNFDLVKQYPHDIEALKGYWRLFPQGKNRTLAVYVVSLQAPPGLMAIAGEKLANSAIRTLLRIPHDVRKWMSGPNYKKR
jgi:ribosome-associated toxin RatA of RatAB toxin-antitoxin module